MMKPATKFLIAALFIVLALPGTALALDLITITKEVSRVVDENTPAVMKEKVSDTTTVAEKVAGVTARLSSSSKQPNKEVFCSTLSETKEKLNGAVASKEEAVVRYVDGLGQNLEDERNSRDAKLEEARSEADQLRSEGYARLMDRADGDDEEDAVADYQKRVEEAIDDRRDAIDAAIIEFRKGVDALVAKRKTTMYSARDAFKTSVALTTKRLETDCANGIATATLLSDFKTSLASARTKLAIDKKAVESMQEEVKKLADTRKTSVAAAVKTFQAELALANAELKQAFEVE